MTALRTSAAFVVAWSIALTAIGAPPDGDIDRLTEDHYSSHQPGFSSRISIDVTEKQLPDIVDVIRSASGANIVLDRGLEEETVTIALVDVPWRKALDLVSEKAGCLVDDAGNGILRVRKPPRVTFYFPDTDIRKVIDAVAKVSGANIIVAPEVQGTVNMRLTDIPWRTALDSICKTLGYTVVQDSQNILRVVSPATLVDQLETRVFELKYVKPPETYVPLIESDYAMGDPKAPSQDPEEDFTILKALRKALSSQGSMEYISGRNMLVVTDTRPVLDAMERMIERIDQEPAQIFVDVKFVTTSNRDFFDFGTDVGDQGWQISTSGGSIPSRLPFDLGDGGFEDWFIAQDDGDGPFGFPDFGPGDPLSDGSLSGVVSGQSAVQYGTLDFTRASLTLRLLKRDSTTKIVQAPKLLALDHETATIVVGETVRFAQVEAEQGQAGGLRVGIEEADNSPVQTGFQLLFTPHIIPGTDKIILTVIPKEESLTGSSTEMPGFDVFSFGAGGSQASIPLPRVASRTLVTKMLLESGQTAVIGGLLFETESETIQKLPFLGDIPFIGWLFRNETSNRVKENLIVFITPTIVRSASETRGILRDELRNGMKDLEAEFPTLFNPKMSKDWSYADRVLPRSWRGDDDDSEKDSKKKNKKSKKDDAEEYELEEIESGGYELEELDSDEFELEEIDG